MRDKLAKVGAVAYNQIGGFGAFCRFAASTGIWIVKGVGRMQNWRLVAPQMYQVGVLSLPVVMITGTFIGMVLAVQTADQFQRAGLEDQLGLVINITVVSELGPVLAGVMLAGRVGGALTAELGTMNVTEQIDALRAMGSDPIRYLVAPRFIACIVLTPFLTIYADLLAVAAGWVISTQVFGIASAPYWHFSAQAIENWDIGVGLLKSLSFGGAIALIACFKGFHCRLGAEGVGRACTESFVSNFICILILDFFIGLLLKATYEFLYGFKSVI
jgi:phospholipid/cholesterol/gamma-HCH transport system permease protein